MKKMILLAMFLMSLSFTVFPTKPGDGKKEHVTPGLLLPYQQEQISISEYILEIHKYNNEMRHVMNMLVIIYSVNLVLKAVEVTSSFVKEYCRYCTRKRRRLERLKNPKKETDGRTTNSKSGDSDTRVSTITASGTSPISTEQIGQPS